MVLDLAAAVLRRQDYLDITNGQDIVLRSSTSPVLSMRPLCESKGLCSVYLTWYKAFLLQRKYVGTSRAFDKVVCILLLRYKRIQTTANQINSQQISFNRILHSPFYDDVELLTFSPSRRASTVALYFT